MSLSSQFSFEVDKSSHTISNSRTFDRDPERMGLLSLTLAPSPGIRWILPARIRNSRRNDVVFVGNTYIQLREFHDQRLAKLSDAIARLDLGTQILGVKVISAKVETIPILDAIRNQEYDEERYLVDGKPCTDGQPPQILVIATASNDLIYVYAKDLDDGKNVAFVYAKRALLGGTTVLEKHPRHMAIDPNCRIMAVGSHSAFAVFSLKEVDELKQSIDDWKPDDPHSFQPSHEQRMLQVDGHILKMDFLQPTEQEPEKAILLLVVVKAATSHLLMYKWDLREPLDQMQPVNEPPQLLQAEDGFPLLLIPSRKSASFILITEYSYVFISNSRDRGVERRTSALFNRPGVRSDSLWVQWAKPLRHERYSSGTEDILLMREDGLLTVTQRTMSTDIVTTYAPGALKTSIDTAICMLRGPRHLGGDILIVAGTMSDGGVYHLPPRQDVYMLQVIPNTSPIHDIVMVNSSTNKKQDIRARRTFAVAGHSRSNNPNELRFGFEAQIGWNLPLSHDGPVNRMWVLEHMKSGTLFILASHLEHTTAVSFDIQSEQFAEMDPLVYPGLQLDEPTFAASMLLRDVSVQITSKHIAVGIETESPVFESIGECICATINVTDNMFAIACRSLIGNSIQIGMICKSNTTPSIVLSQPLGVPQLRPLSLELFRLLDNQYLCVGYLDGTVEIFSIDSEGKLTSKNRLEPDNHGISAVTSLVALCHAGISRMILLAGTRDGKVKAFKISFELENDVVRVDCRIDREYQIDTKPITVIHAGSATDQSYINAMIQSETRLDQITSFRNAAGTEYVLTNVWLTERNNLMYKNNNLTAIQSVQNLLSPINGIPNNFLMCASKGEIIFAEVIEHEQIIPRRISFNCQGARLLMYSDYLQKLVVASNPEANTRGSDKKIDTSSKFPMLCLIDPDKHEHGSEKEVRLGDQDERVTALLAWEPSDGHAHRSLIVICLSSERESRLGCVSQKRMSTNPGSVSLKTIVTFPKKKIHAICSLELSSLAISVGRDIIVLKYQFHEKRWHEEGRFAVPSPVRSVSSQGSLIYAATESHSIVVLRWRKTTKQFEQILWDRIARNTRAVVPFGNNGDHVLFNIASAQGTCVSAYPIHKTSVNRQSPLFEADLPLGIEQIVQIPSSWTESKQYAFQGCAYDGTVYVFQTLTHDEWKLLRFLEQLTKPDPVRATTKPLSLLPKSMSKKLWRAAKEEGLNIHMPKKMHIQGDVLKRLVEQRPSNLHSLLGTQVKKEEDAMSIDEENSLMSKLEKLAIPVVGEAEDLPATVIAWTRKMLRATIF